jgi:hypothetical protein
MHQHIIELLSYALVLTGNHIFTSGAPGTNAAAIRGALRAERPDLLTVVLPQSLSKQPEETQQLLAQVGAELFFLFIITTNNKQTNCLSNFYVPKELKHLIDAVLLDLNLKNPQPLATSAAASTPLLLLLSSSSSSSSSFYARPSVCFSAWRRAFCFCDGGRWTALWNVLLTMACPWT